MAGLQVKNLLNLSPPYYSGGYPGEDVGGSGDYSDWTEVPLVGISNSYYWYSDSDTADNANSIKVFVEVEDSWSAVINNDNSITVSYNTRIKKIDKRYIYGNPGTWTRNIRISACPTCPIIYSFNNTPYQIYTVASNLNTISGSFTLPPESEQSTQNTLYYKSFLPGHEFDPLPSQYVDAMGMGLAFKNTLPKDYRPGKTLDEDSIWQSHNRTAGVANIRTDSSWRTMRTSDGAVSKGNRPTIKHDDDWYNMRKIGDNA